MHIFATVCKLINKVKPNLEAEAAEPKQREGNRGPSEASKLDTPETSNQAQSRN